MTVYVESNFVLELALEQQQAAAAETILARAERRQIELAMPALSLSEPFSTGTHRTRRRRALAIEVDGQLTDLRRSAAHQEAIAALEPIQDVLEQVGQDELDGLVSTVDRLLATATIIPTDLLAFRSAVRYRSDYGLTVQDAIIYAATVGHLTQNPSAGPHFFISRDRKAFSHPGIASEIGQHDCVFVPSFDEGAQRLNRPRIS